MKAKLSKIEPHYFLIVDGKTFGSTMEPHLSASIRHSLSLKNCQAIERGYDLDELFDEVEKSIVCHEFDFISFKAGAEAIFELMGDKKFSEKELTILFAYGHQIGMNDVLAIQSQHSPQPMPRPDSDKLRDELIQSLQQNEWEVEIEMECTQCQSYGYVSECRDNCNKKFLQPKLDADGCLILKTFKSE